MVVELVGTLKVIFQPERVGDNLDKQNIVVTIDENTSFPQDILVQALNKRMDGIKNFNMGSRVKVKCYLKGKQNPNKAGSYFNQLDLAEISRA